MNYGKRLLQQVITNISLLVIIFLYFILADDQICYYKSLFGLPCPGCGMTRAFIYFFQLDLQKAFYNHPLFILVPFILSVLLFKKHNNFLKRLYNNSYFWIALLILFIVTYIIRMIILFPEKKPMDFNRNALLIELLRYLRIID